jgi:hypothetical protein
MVDCGLLRPRLGRFTPGKETWYPLYKRLRRPRGLSGRVRKFSPPPGFDPRIVQPVASRYTEYAVPAHPSLSVMNIMRILYGLELGRAIVSLRVCTSCNCIINTRKHF